MNDTKSPNPLDTFVAIDVETANRQPTSICAIGAVKVVGGVVTDRFYELVRPEPDHYEWMCQRVHGLGHEDTDTARCFGHVWRDLARMIGDLPLVAHNKRFDENCLRQACRMYQIDWPDNPFHCTLAQARRTIPRQLIGSYALDVLADFLAIPFTDHHNALADAEACAKIALAIFKP